MVPFLTKDHCNGSIIQKMASQFFHVHSSTITMALYLQLDHCDGSAHGFGALLRERREHREEERSIGRVMEQHE